MGRGRVTPMATLSAVDLPWPPKELSPNARLNWRAKHRRRHAYRHTCSWTCVEQKLRRIEADRVHATIKFYPPDARHRDVDNMLASIKAGIDAVAEAIGVDDSRWTITLRVGPHRKPGCVRIEIEALVCATCGQFPDPVNSGAGKLCSCTVPHSSSRILASKQVCG